MGKSTLMSVRQVSDKLKISTQYIYSLIKDGKIEAEQVGGFWMLEASEVNRLADMIRRAGKSEADLMSASH
jgi:excisionase family DNA binding protein